MLGSLAMGPAHGHHDHRVYDDIARGGEWKEEFRDGPCEVKIESKGGEYGRVLKCKSWCRDRGGPAGEVIGRLDRHAPSVADACPCARKA